MRLGLSEDSRILKAFIYNPPPEPVMRNSSIHVELVLINVGLLLFYFKGLCKKGN